MAGSAVTAGLTLGPVPAVVARRRVAIVRRRIHALAATDRDRRAADRRRAVDSTTSIGVASNARNRTVVMPVSVKVVADGNFVVVEAADVSFAAAVAVDGNLVAAAAEVADTAVVVDAAAVAVADADRQSIHLATFRRTP